MSNSYHYIFEFFDFGITNMIRLLFVDHHDMEMSHHDEDEMLNDQIMVKKIQ